MAHKSEKSFPCYEANQRNVKYRVYLERARNSS